MILKKHFQNPQFQNHNLKNYFDEIIVCGNFQIQNSSGVRILKCYLETTKSAGIHPTYKSEADYPMEVSSFLISH